MNKKRVLIILISPFIVVLIFMLINFMHIRLPITWMTYYTDEYGFSVKHPLFLGSNLLIPAMFTENEPHFTTQIPKPLYNTYPVDESIENDEIVPKTDDDEVLIDYLDYKYLLASGGGPGPFSEGANAEPNLLTVLIFENRNGVSFEKYINDAYKIYVDNFNKFHIGNNDQQEIYKWKVNKNIVRSGNNEGVMFNKAPPSSWENEPPRKLMYYQKLDDKKILIIVAEGYNNSDKVFSNMIKTIQLL